MFCANLGKRSLLLIKLHTYIFQPFKSALPAIQPWCQANIPFRINPVACICHHLEFCLYHPTCRPEGLSTIASRNIPPVPFIHNHKK
jgi:hypothetical protein